MSSEKCIPISIAQAIAEALELRQVIIVAWDGENTQVATYGGSAEDSANAARGGNFVKKALGWPLHTDTESPKVQGLQNRIAELESKLNAITQPSVFPVVFVCEYGESSMPAGYMAFTSEEDAKDLIRKANQKKQSTGMLPPDGYVRYLGAIGCSRSFYKSTALRNVKNFELLSELYK